MSVDVLTPNHLTLPTIGLSLQSSNAPTGQVGMSGSDIVFFNGTSWSVVSTA